MQEMVLTPEQAQVVAPTTDDDLTELLNILNSRGLIRRTHKLRLLKAKTAVAWYWLPRTRRSFRAVLRLQALCSAENVRMLLTLRWIAAYQLEAFIKRTKLGEGPRAILEGVVREENQRIAAHTNTGNTSELHMIANGAAAAQTAGSGGTVGGTQLRTTIATRRSDGVARYRRGQQV